MNTDRALDTFIANLDIEKWNDYSAAERIEILQKFENIMAENSHRDPVMIQVMPEDFVKENPSVMGYHCPDGIFIHPRFLKRGVSIRGLSRFHLAGALELIAHEGRHAWQEYVVNHPEKNIVDRDTRLSIQMNFDNYSSGNANYGGQLIELDARRFARKTLEYINQKLEEKTGEIYVQFLDEIRHSRIQDRAWAMELLRNVTAEELIKCDLRARKFSEKRHPGVSYEKCSIFSEAIKFIKSRRVDEYIDGEPIQIKKSMYKEKADRNSDVFQVNHTKIAERQNTFKDRVRQRFN